VWVDVPTTTGADPGATTAFALRALQPNQSWTVWSIFSLPSGDRAARAVDRRPPRVERQVGSLGAGTHRVDLDGARSSRQYVLLRRARRQSQTAS
jgi:hypothetical protein